VLQAADAAPTTQAVAACGEAQQLLDRLLQLWSDLKTKELSDVNEQLRRANVPPLEFR
jgi:hypothetical protein